VAASADAIPTDQINLHRLAPIARITANSWDPAHPAIGCLDPRNHDGWSPSQETEGPVHLTVTFGHPLKAEQERFLTTQLNFGVGGGLIAGHFELFALTGTDDGTDVPEPVLEALNTVEDKRTPEMAALLWDWCAKTSEELRRSRVELANIEERLVTLTKPQPTMVMSVAEKPRPTRILNRGDYSQPGELVEPGTVASLPPMPPEAPRNRLGLAKWVTMRENPLTARVAVNRIWKLFFGTGLVATAADFGAQGQWPSHPELLDWLAVEFMESGWDVKHLISLIVTSDTYRQTSHATKEALENDPQNRLLARGPRFRLPAELIRDNALSISGLLVPRIGGPSVNPYAPGDLWREVSHYGSTPATAQTFVQEHGEKLYRRSMYTYWKRTAPPPAMTAFDAPTREVCTVDRAATTTPLQALVPLNDPQFVEAARAFAERVLDSPGDDLARLRFAFGETVSRPPAAAEERVLLASLARERKIFSGRPDAATAFLATGESPRDAKLPVAEHAAWAQVCATLLNLSETITRN
jgi:hypothetical protein